MMTSSRRPRKHVGPRGTDCPHGQGTGYSWIRFERTIGPRCEGLGRRRPDHQLEVLVVGDLDLADHLEVGRWTGALSAHLARILSGAPAPVTSGYRRDLAAGRPRGGPNVD
jgi:hypothetical protein